MAPKRKYDQIDDQIGEPQPKFWRQEPAQWKESTLPCPRWDIHVVFKDWPSITNDAPLHYPQYCQAPRRRPRRLPPLPLVKPPPPPPACFPTFFPQVPMISILPTQLYYGISITITTQQEHTATTNVVVNWAPPEIMTTLLGRTYKGELFGLARRRVQVQILTTFFRRT